MSVRNCGELGVNLQKIVSRLLANDELVKLLYFEDKDPRAHDDLTAEEKQQLIFEKLVKVTPRVLEDENNKSYVVIYITKGEKLHDNGEFVDIEMSVDVITPLENWIIKDSNLRPFAILGEVQKSLEGKTVNGLGVIRGGDFALTRLTDKSSIYTQTFLITAYD